MRTAIAVAIALSSAAARAGATYGIQRTRTSGVPLWRPQGPIAVAFDAGIDATARAVIAAGFHAWESATAPCGTLRFAIGGSDPITVIIRRDQWSHASDSASLTSLTYIDAPDDPDDGKIVGGEVELDEVDFELLLPGATAMTGKPALDLQSVATHEAGHVLGLDHDCASDGASWPTDEAGERVPACDAPDARVRAETMFFRIQPGELSARMPDADDVAGACAVLDHLGGDRDVIGTCSSSGGSSWPLALVAAWLLRRRTPCDDEAPHPHHDGPPPHPALRGHRPAR